VRNHADEGNNFRTKSQSNPENLRAEKQIKIHRFVQQYAILVIAPILTEDDFL